MFNFIRRHLNSETTQTTDNLSNGQQYVNLPPPNPYSVQTAVERDPRTIGIDINEEIERIKATWRGMRLSDDGENWIPIKDSIKMISESGAETLLGLHQQMMSIPHATTNLEDTDIFMVCKVYGNNLNEQVCSMYRVWEIPKAFFDSIIDPLVNSLYMFLLKSKHDKQRMWDNRSPAFNNPNPINQGQLPLTP